MSIRLNFKKDFKYFIKQVDHKVTGKLISRKNIKCMKRTKIHLQGFIYIFASYLLNHDVMQKILAMLSVVPESFHTK